MLTGQSDPRLRRYRPLLALAAGLLIALVATSGAIALAARGGERTARSSSCPGSAGSAMDASTAATAATDADAGATAVSATSATSSSRASEAALAEDASTGVDLEVRIGRIRVEFPWLKTLPITPGRHIVFTLLPAVDTEPR